MKNNNPSTLNDALAMYHKAKELYKQNNFPDALKLYEQGMLIYEHLAPESLAVSRFYGSIGRVYSDQGKLNDTLRYYEKALRIEERLVPDSLDVAESYNNIGCIYSEQGKLGDALHYFEKSLLIEERLEPDSLGVALTYNNIGNIYFDQDNLAEALRCYETALRIEERVAPDSLDMAASYNNIGEIYTAQGNLSDALALYEKSLFISERLAPNSLDAADHYCNIGTVYTMQNQLSEALTFYNKALKIRVHLSPNSLGLAEVHSKIAHVYKLQNKLSDALPLYESAFHIKARDLIPTHASLITLSHTIADLAFQLDQTDVALKYINTCIQKNKTFKYAHDLRGLILQKQDKLDEALASFNKALICDSGFADAMIHKANLLKQAGCIQAADNAIAQAMRMQKTNYDSNLKAQYEHEAKESKQSLDCQLPVQEYVIGDQKLAEKLAELTNENLANKARLTVLERRVDGVENHIDIIVSRMDVFEKKIYDLKHSIMTLSNVVGVINERLKQVTDDEALIALLQEKRKSTELEKQIKALNHNHDMADFFHALLTQVSAAYIAAQAIASDEVEMKKSRFYQGTADAAGTLLSLLPVVGTLASSIVSGIGVIADTRQQVIERNELLRIRELVLNMEEFDKIALRLALLSTLDKQQHLLGLDGAKVPQDWKSHMKGMLTNGLEGLMTSLLSDNKTVAKIWGVAEAQAIIKHLSQDHVAENYREAKERLEPDTITFRSKYSFTAHSIFTRRRNQHMAVDITPLIDQCDTHAASFNNKQKVAVNRLKNLLEQRVDGKISSRDVLDYVSSHLTASNDTVFGRYYLRSCYVQKLFQKCRDVLNEDIAKTPEQAVARAAII